MDEVVQVRIGGVLYNIGDSVDRSAIADEYSTTTNYYAPDVVFYNGSLYRCKSWAHGTFDPDAWEEITVSEDLNKLWAAARASLLGAFSKQLYGPGTIPWSDDNGTITVGIPIPSGGCVVLFDRYAEVDHWYVNGNYWTWAVPVHAGIAIVHDDFESDIWIGFEGGDLTKEEISQAVTIWVLDETSSCLGRNNPDAVSEFLNYADKHYKAQIPLAVMQYQGYLPSMQYQLGATSNGDFVLKCLAGGTGKTQVGNLYQDNQSYPWSEVPEKWENTSFLENGASVFEQVRTPYQLAKWMCDHGQCVLRFNPHEFNTVTINGKTYAKPTESFYRRGLSFEDIRKGDLVFFAEKVVKAQDETDYMEPYGFQRIDHVAIVCDVEVTETYNSEAAWNHTILEHISPANAQAHGGTLTDDGVDDFESNLYLKRELWVDPVDAEGLEYDGEVAWGGTMVMVCRPDLKTPGINSLANEAMRMGLHAVPKNWGVMNAIKRARQLTDVKWTPVVDIPRYSLSHWEDGEPVFYEGAKFKAGVEYQGIPCMGDSAEYEIVGDVSVDSFASSVGIEGTWASEGRVGWSMGDFIGDLVLNAWSSDEHYEYNKVELGAFDGDAIITDIIYENGVPIMCEYSFLDVGGCANSADKDGPVGGLARRVWYPAPQIIT